MKLKEAQHYRDSTLTLSITARKQETKNKKYAAKLVFATIILFSYLLLALPVHAVDMGEIRSGETKNGNIAIAGQTDSYTFEGKKGQAVVIKMVDINDSTGDLFEPQILLFKPGDGSIEKKMVSKETASIEDHNLEQTGVYTIVVGDNGADTGEYNLSLTLIGRGENGSKNESDESESEIEEAEKDKTIESIKTICENGQVMFQGECIEISSLLRKNERTISKEEYKSIIEKFNILKVEDEEKLKKLAAYLEDQIQPYLNKHEYEAAKTYGSLLETTYYQLEDEHKVYEAKKSIKEIKRKHFIYKFTHPFNDPLEAFSAIIFEIALAGYLFIYKKTGRKMSLLKIVVIFVGVLVLLWTAISIFLTILR